TTENPSFELNGALLSRTQVLVLRRLDDAALEMLLERAETHYGERLKLTDDARASLRAMADGDGRYMLNLAEEVSALRTAKPLDSAALMAAVQRRAPLYDKSREEHYNLISALHKSIRGSDPDAALYWLARMLAGGEQPLYIARRLVRASVEDIGLADPQAVVQAIAAKDVYDFLGSPEGEIALVQCVLYLASAPKSNAVYKAHGAALRSAKEHGSLMPPAHILNAPTKLMKNLGYGKGYEYDHEAEEGFSGQNYFPETMERQNFYAPKETGFEREIAKRLDYWAKLRAKRAAGED
ncbi:MAG TPA: recombination factor protein RarA, partial [Rhizomicrobium sp.]